MYKVMKVYNKKKMINMYFKYFLNLLSVFFDYILYIKLFV